MESITPSAGSIPAASETIPVGLSTKVGLVASALLGLAAALAAVLNGDHTPETLTALGGAVLTLVTVIAGRQAQATAVNGEVARALTERRLEALK